MFRCEITEAQAPLRTVGQERNLTVVGKFCPDHDHDDYDDSSHNNYEEHDNDDDHKCSHDEVLGR